MKTWTTVLCAAAALLAGCAKKKDAGVDAPDALNDPPAGDKSPKAVKAPKVDVMDISLKEVQKTLKEVKEDYENKKQTIADPLKFPLKTQDEE